MRNRAFETEAFLRHILTFLSLNEIPRFERINKSTRNLIKELYYSRKFQKASGISALLLESLQKDATVILSDPEVAYDEENPGLKAALQNIMNGTIDAETLKIIREQKLKYQSPDYQEKFHMSGEIIKATGKIAEAAVKPHRFPISAQPAPFDQVTGAVILFMLFSALVLALYAGVEYGINTCIHSRRAKKQQDKFQRRLLLFNDLPEIIEEKSEKEVEKSPRSSGLTLGLKH